METSRRVTRVSGQQIEILWELLNSHKDVASSFNRSLQAKEYSRRKWSEFAEILNCQGDGAHKDWRRWSKYWVDYKAKLKSRLSSIRSSHARTGGGSSIEKPLTEMEEKFLLILGNDFGQGLPGIRVEAFDQPSETPVVSDAVLQEESSPASVSILTIAPTLDPPFTPLQNVEHIYTQSVQETLSENPPEAVPPAPSLGFPSPPPHPVTPTRSPRQRRGRRLARELPMSQEAARRSLVRSAQQRAEATVRIAESFNQMVQLFGEYNNTTGRIERILRAAFPTDAERENSS